MSYSSFNIELFLQNYLLRKILKPDQSLISFELSNIKPTSIDEIKCSFAILFSVNSEFKIHYDCLIIEVVIDFINFTQNHSIYRFLNFQKIINLSWPKFKIVEEFHKLFQTNNSIKSYIDDIIKCDNFNIFNHVTLKVLGHDNMLSFFM